MDAELAALKDRCAALEARADRTDRLMFYILASASLLVLVLSAVVPFVLLPHEPGVSIFSAAVSLPTVDTERDEAEALIGGIFAWVYLICIALTFAAVVVMMLEVTARRCKFVRDSSVMLLVGSACAYLAVAIMVAEFEANGFSPAVALAVIGALLALAAAKWGPNFLVHAVIETHRD